MLAPVVVVVVVVVVVRVITYMGMNMQVITVM
jgi:hypothetical protein